MKRGFYTGLLVSLFWMMPIFADNIPDQSNNPDKPDKIKLFIDNMVQHHHFDRATLTELLSHVQYNQEVVNRITHPYEEKPWHLYRAHFITRERVSQGVRYWAAHEAALQYAQNHYGIPASLIVAIIGIETNYGDQMGTYSALNALATLAFYHEPRASFFTQELTHFLLLTEEQRLPTLQIKSSYAGALGIPQFMPSTYRHYAVKYPAQYPIKYQKTDGVDLINNNNDAIVSIANYLAQNGWHRQEPITTVFNRPVDEKLISAHAKPTLSLRQLRAMGISLHHLPNTNKPIAAIIALTNEHSTEHWLALHNFKVIMRYNPHIIYTMAIYQLSQEIQKARTQGLQGADVAAHAG